MFLPPSIGITTLDSSHADAKSRAESFYNDAITLNLAFQSEALIDTRFLSGDQSIWNDLYGNLPVAQRKQFNFNRILRIHNMITGRQRQNRKSIVVVPVQNANGKTADQYTRTLMWAMSQTNGLDVISDAFSGAMTTGMNLVEISLDYRKDPVSGDIKLDTCPFNSFVIDPYFRKTSLEDCRGIWKRSYLSKREIMTLMPDYKGDIMPLQGEVGGNMDGKFMFMPQAYQYGPRNLLTYDEFYYRDFRKQKLIRDNKTGEVIEWRSDNEELLTARLQQYPDLEVIESEIPTVRLTILVQNRIMYDGPHPLGIDNYNFVPVLGYYYPELPYMQNRCQGIVRSLRDSQYLFNRRKVIELDILESQLNSGYIVKEDALVNPKDGFQVGQGKMLFLKRGANMTDIQQIQSPVIPPTTLQVSQALSQEMQEISGISEELLGGTNESLSGYHAMLRMSSGLTTLQKVFDQLDLSQKIIGKRILDVIQTNFAPGKIQRIIGSQEELSPQFHNKEFGTYDVEVEEGFNTSTQRQMQFAQLLSLKEAGVPIPNQALVEAATIQNKDKLIEMMQQEQQAAQQQSQQQAQVQQQELMARAELSKARAAADMGLYVERTSRVEENRALAIERMSESKKDLEMATLNKIKALKELEGMDLEHLEKLITLANLLKPSETKIVSQAESTGVVPEQPQP